MELPLISIIIPVYNAEKYLKRCLNSILPQNYKNLEVILIDDGSSDSSPEICDQFVKDGINGLNFKVYHQQNTGASIARKNGIKVASGDYIAFVDADDIVSPNYVSALYQALLKHHTSISVCRYEVGSDGQDFKFSEGIESRLLGSQELFNRFFKYEFWGYPGALYKRTLFENVDFPEATVNEDYFVKAQLFCQGAKVAEVTSPLYYYEKHEASLSDLQLSERALGEFDNAYATWLYVQRHNPKYSKKALAIVSEVAAKWICRLRKKEAEANPKFLKYINSIQRFIRGHFGTIILNPNLYWKIKVSLIIGLIRSY